MEFRFLGSGSWNGIPAPFCDCSVCSEAVSPENKNYRTRPFFEVSGGAGKFFIDPGPDIRLQSAYHGIKGLEEVLVSHWHYDHLYGLMEIPAWQETVGNSVRVHCSENTRDHIEEVFGHVDLRPVVLEPFKSFDLNGIEVTPFPVQHMFDGGEEVDTYGFLLEEEGSSIAYMADYYEVPENSKSLIEGVDILIPDGTYLYTDEAKTKRTQQKIEGSSNHMIGESILRFVKEIEPKRAVFHSISHIHGMRHKELRDRLPGRMEPSYDGMVLSL